ncbi:MAG: RNA polymerase sigma factor [Bacteroidota bacterium]
MKFLWKFDPIICNDPSTILEKVSTTLSQEQHIVHLLKKQDQRVIELIYTRYSHNLFNVILRIVKDQGMAQDVFQETIIKIWKKGHFYDRAKGSLYTWLVSICKHAAIDKTRSREYKQAIRTAAPEEICAPVAADPHKLNDQQAHLKQMLTNLPAHQRQIIDMAYFQGFTQEEIAHKLGIPKGTVKSRIRLALNQLRKVMHA